MVLGADCWCLQSVLNPSVCPIHLGRPSHVRHAYFVKVIEALGLGGAPKEKHPKGHKGSKAAAAKAVVAAAKAAKAAAKAAGSCIVFTSTCRSCEELALLLQEFGVMCVSLHSQMSQSDRMASLAKFRSSYVRILIATDVASRGLDIAPVAMVLNFNVPKVFLAGLDIDHFFHLARPPRRRPHTPCVARSLVPMLFACRSLLAMR